MRISSGAQIFARHTERNNVGDNLRLNADYTYRYSPRLTLHLSDRLQRRGRDRFGGFGGFGNRGSFEEGGGLGGLGEAGRTSPTVGEGDLLSSGAWLRNEIRAGGKFLYTSNVTLRPSYTWEHVAFLDEGGQETIHSLGIRGTYQWWRQHNLHAHYTVRMLTSRAGDRHVLHDFALGDDYFGSRQIQLTPTLSVSGSTGIALRTGDNGSRLANSLNLALAKIWGTAAWTTGVRRGLTSSFGVAGPSFTTRFFSSYQLQLTQRLTALVSTNFALFDTDRADFKTLHILARLTYQLTTWLSMSFIYRYQWLDPEGGATARGVFRRSITDSNSISVFFSTHFDIWPNAGLTKGLSVFQSFLANQPGGANAFTTQT